MERPKITCTKNENKNIAIQNTRYLKYCKYGNRISDLQCTLELVCCRYPGIPTFNVTFNRAQLPLRLYTLRTQINSSNQQINKVAHQIINLPNTNSNIIIFHKMTKIIYFIQFKYISYQMWAMWQEYYHPQKGIRPEKEKVLISTFSSANSQIFNKKHLTNNYLKEERNQTNWLKMIFV